MTRQLIYDRAAADELGDRVADALWEENDRGPGHAYNAVVDRCRDAGYVFGIDYSAEDDPLNLHPHPLTPPQAPRPPSRPGGSR